eukprot:CAMPEP_0179376314 /NCGR_PEP_ID=MMETSP0797-20121207/88254_1 /TAXON_ID=47934 /ORGANISM="Dinophysis acuminata, Strain DAEP01" /LENGTH=95 /DNA_ID=CAMNT_0021092347 /DNA_START=252 /DNA_END=537 /DNA_ORIENTATION=+
MGTVCPSGSRARPYSVVRNEVAVPVVYWQPQKLYELLDARVPTKARDVHAAAPLLTGGPLATPANLHARVDEHGVGHVVQVTLTPARPQSPRAVP